MAGMRVRILVSTSHPEYRLILPAGTDTVDLEPAMRAAADQLGPWEERSQDDLDGNRPEHLEAMEAVTSSGACLWMISATYTGRVVVSQG